MVKKYFKATVSYSFFVETDTEVYAEDGRVVLDPESVARAVACDAFLTELCSTGWSTPKNMLKGAPTVSCIPVTKRVATKGGYTPHRWPVEDKWQGSEEDRLAHVALMDSIYPGFRENV